MIVRRRSALALPLAILAAPHVAGAQAARRLKLGHNNSVTSSLHAGAVRFAELLAAESSGRLQIEIVPNSALGTEAQMLKSVADGTLDLTLAPIGTTAALAKEVGLVETPYLFADAAAARTALDGPLGAHCAALLREKGIEALAWGEVGVRHVTANRPVRNPAELRGLKIRVPLSEVIMESFKAMGAAAEPLPFPQLPEALRTGRFEAQENPVGIIVAARLATVQSHLSLTGHVYTPFAFAASPEVLEELTQAQRDLVRAAARQGAVASREAAARGERDGLAELRTAGMTIVDNVDQAAFRLAASAAFTRLDQVFGAATTARMRQLAA